MRPSAPQVPLAEKLLEVAQELIRTALDLELQEGTVVADRVAETPCVFLAGLHRAERTVAERLMRLANGTLPWPWIDPDKALPWVEKHIGLALAESQVAAIRLALMSKVLVMTGGPGVGKTTIVKAILRILAAKGTDLLLCAPTGRAAKRMTEATGFEAKTIHRLLEVDPKGGGFKRGDDNPLDCDLLVVDEASMVDVVLMQALMKAVPDKAALLIVGDIDQLPSVGPGQVLADVISSGAVPVVRLTEVFRQAARAASSPAPIASTRARSPISAHPEPRATSTSCKRTIPKPPCPHHRTRENTDPKRFGLDPIRDIQVLCPMNRGGVGARSLNIELQAALNPAGDCKVERFGWTFAPGDKVMQIENDYDKEVYNGDIGYINDVDPNAGEVIASLRRSVCHIRIWRTRHASAGLRRDHPQKPGLGISRRSHPGAHPALRHAPAKPALYRRHARQAAGRVGRAEESRRHRRPKRVGSAALVEVERMAEAKKIARYRRAQQGCVYARFWGAAEAPSHVVAGRGCSPTL